MDTLTAPAPFVFDKNYKNNEQVRPYFEDYSRVRAELDAANQYPYNDLFKGRIPGIDGPNEDTAIYLLQTMHDLDALAVRIEDFLAQDGARWITAEDLATTQILRGTVVDTGFYVGGTGWKAYESARLVISGGSASVLPKGKRSRGYLLCGRVLLLPA